MAAIDTRPLVTVCGATGAQGSSVAQYLLRDGGYRVRVLTRNVDSEKSQALKQQGAEVFRCDLGEIDQVTAALDGAYAVFGLTNFWEHGEETEVRQGKNLADVAKTCRIEHFIWSSCPQIDDIGAPRHWVSKVWVENIFMRLGIAFFPVKRVSDDSLILDWFIHSDTHIPSFSVEELGAWFLVALKGPETWIGKQMKVCSDIINPRDCAAKLSDALEVKVGLKEVNADAFEASRPHVPDDAWLNFSKGVAVLLSGSVSIWASFVDSFMDFLSTVIVIWTTYVCPALSLVLKGREIKGGRSIVCAPIYKFRITIPHSSKATGKQRMEPLGVVIFSVFMIAMFLQVGVEGCKRLLSGSREEFSLDKTTIAIMVVTIATKTVAWLLSAQIKSNGVQALAQDNKNDVFFTTFSVIFPGLAGATNLPWLDPLGGIILSLYIIIEWTETLMLNFRQLSGRAADPDEYQRMLYLITRFTTPQVSYLEVYHAGTELICEADVQFPKQTSFEEVHNVSEAIQVALECLEDVNRAYIHADFTVLNPASHVRRIS
ncbi:NmrA-like family domain-containing protein 1 [Rhizoctonia solani]|uniref:NmrA-like family domain-containing protein 1 n=1 Tax=Rhizoctonia solani TaxID=456999 RepID=A0A8H8P3Y5_9AGAM|nr:NmrA-like family domain-containing protein 1 [Rhizoctonia solani]QRW23902.1 NmrA-like family domain-containing protein 1 [Rhizoctonia solani]